MKKKWNELSPSGRRRRENSKVRGRQHRPGLEKRERRPAAEEGIMLKESRGGWQSPISKDLENWKSGWGCWEEPWLRVINMSSKERETQTSRGSRVPGFHGYLGTHSCSIRAAPVSYSYCASACYSLLITPYILGFLGWDLGFLLHPPLCFCIWAGISLKHASPRNRFSNPVNHMPRGPVRVGGDLETWLCLRSNPWRSPIDELTWDRVTYGGGQLRMASSSIWVNGAIQQGWVQCEALLLPLLGTKKSLRDRLRYTILLSNLGAS